jgi:hypothetical protein
LGPHDGCAKRLLENKKRKKFCDDYTKGIPLCRETKNGFGQVERKYGQTARESRCRASKNSKGIFCQETVFKIKSNHEWYEIAALIFQVDVDVDVDSNFYLILIFHSQAISLK